MATMTVKGKSIWDLATYALVGRVINTAHPRPRDGKWRRGGIGVPTAPAVVCLCLWNFVPTFRGASWAAGADAVPVGREGPASRHGV